MVVELFTLRFQFVAALLACAAAGPAPGRVPRVYNALITSSQNLEPSRAHPVYQPVLHDAFGLYQPAVFYRGDLIGNGLLPTGPVQPKQPQQPQVTPNSKSESAPESPAQPPEESPSSTQAPESEPSKVDPSESATPAPPSPPNTQSPIPLNEFGLPPQVVPLGQLGHIDPAYGALPQFSPFGYGYPGIRFYDPYDPYAFSSYTGFPLYHPLTNFLGPSIPVVTGKEAAKVESTSESSAQTPPSEPSDLNILNYSSKDPAIPNVPPPPLPQGGLKADKPE